MVSRNFDSPPGMPAIDFSRSGAGTRAARAAMRRRADDQAEQVDGCLESDESNVLVMTKRTNTMRDVRSALLGLAYALSEDDERRGHDNARLPAVAVFVLVDSRVQGASLESELRRFRTVVTQDLGRRIFAVVAGERGKLDVRKLPPRAPAHLVGYISDLIKKRDDPALRASRVTRQTVKALMLESYLAGAVNVEQLPASVADLQRATGASYPTVARALKELAAKRAMAEGGVQLLRPDPDLWWTIAEGLAAERRVRRFIDPTKQAVRPEQLLAMLVRLREKHQAKQTGRDLAAGIAVGGVLGAKMLYPGLDITAALRLDLCVYDGDESFVRELDPGLQPTEDLKARPVLVLHHTCDVRLIVPTDAGRGRTAGELSAASAVDCYADLLEIGYAGEARDFALAMTRRAGW